MILGRMSATNSHHGLFFLWVLFPLSWALVFFIFLLAKLFSPGLIGSLSGTLYAATALLGICYGAQFRIMIPTTSELFGLRRFGLTFNFMQLGNPAVAFLFSRWLAGHVYDTEAAKQQVSSCMGPNCFRFTFLVLADVCGLGTFLSIILTIRIRPNALCWRSLPSAQKL
ncbi:protein NUCLEAR FUSION DEFECTIVE 4-like [Olea europaea var. sylvestris]|uniref:protein NUCLEAR FUSION DEFECTIVE 4-like n=1 Tax=Olea europaea var. sylvestris TaxID=158386 RepID=UPI000C1D5218|nr:protein NUCLEAR FUSION DEFECTIVE 4-like [Olea europaea var. sylvestris]